MFFLLKQKDEKLNAIRLGANVLIVGAGLDFFKNNFKLSLKLCQLFHK